MNLEKRNLQFILNVTTNLMLIINIKNFITDIYRSEVKLDIMNYKIVKL